MDGPSYFQDAQNFKVDSMNLNNHSGAHNDYRRTDVRNTYQGGGGNAYHTHHDNRRRDYGNRYITTNYNRGPTSTNYHAPTYDFHGPTTNYNAPVNQYNAPSNPTYHYTTHAQGSSVINGNFTGVQYNGSPGRSSPATPDPPTPRRKQKSPSRPQSVGHGPATGASSPQDSLDRHASPPCYDQPHSRIVPVTGRISRGKFNVPQRRYRKPTFNPWANEQPNGSPSPSFSQSKSSQKERARSAPSTAPRPPSHWDPTSQGNSCGDDFVGDTDTDTDSGVETDGCGLGWSRLKFPRGKGGAPGGDPTSIGKGDWKQHNPLLM